MDAPSSQREVDGAPSSEENHKVQSTNESRESSTDSSATKCELPNPTENELINLDDIDFSDEDTWLYTPPKSLSLEEKGLSPYKWLRQDVEDPNNKELQMAKSALVSKLDELDILKSVQKPPICKTKPAVKPRVKECVKKSQEESPVFKDCDNHVNDLKENCNLVAEARASENDSMCAESTVKQETKPLNNVTDVLERARQQEESLKQSSSRFFSQSAKTLPRSRGSLPCSANGQVSGLSKPASVEALHMYGGKSRFNVSSPVSSVQPKTVISSPSVSPYGSTVSLNFNNDAHRSSLPNLNRAYHTLKPKKVKRASEPRVQCPLPAYPKHLVSGGSHEAIQAMVPNISAAKSPTRVYRESQTLPSSYRTKSRNSQNQSHLSLTRRDSDPPPATPCQNNTLKAHIARRESMPTVSPNRPIIRYPKPKNNTQASGQFSQCNGSSQSLLNCSRTASLNLLVPELKKDYGTREHPRCSSHSPVKRQPLTSVHNRSPNRDDHMISSSCNARKSSLPSKIPSPASRSGIPVPSQFMDRTSSADDSWSQDSY